MARKPTLSPTKITTYLACPVKYKWTYVDDRGKWYLKSKSYYSFGTSLHQVLQRFHDDTDTGVATTHQAMAALEESWIEAGYSSPQEAGEAMAEGKAILEAYIEQVAVQPVTAKTLYVEKLLRADLGRFVLVGRVDRVDELSDKSLEVIDYKSGRHSVSPEDVGMDVAMSCYQLLLSEQFPDRRICASIIALRTGEKATAALSVEDLIRFRQDITELGEQILSRDYEGLEPVGKALCHSCDFLPLCRKHPEFQLPE